jgi:hypothetical protein
MCGVRKRRRDGNLPAGETHQGAVVFGAAVESAQHEFGDVVVAGRSGGVVPGSTDGGGWTICLRANRSKPVLPSPPVPAAILAPAVSAPVHITRRSAAVPGRERRGRGRTPPSPRCLRPSPRGRRRERTAPRRWRSRAGPFRRPTARHRPWSLRSPGRGAGGRGDGARAARPRHRRCRPGQRRAGGTRLPRLLARYRHPRHREALPRAFLGKPVLVGGVVVRTGDLVVGDADGLVASTRRRPARWAGCRGGSRTGGR